MRLKMSRPRLSVPSGYPATAPSTQKGGLKRSSKSEKIGSWGSRLTGHSAHITPISTMAMEKIGMGRRRVRQARLHCVTRGLGVVCARRCGKRLSACAIGRSAETDAGIEIRIDHINDQIGD